MLSAEEARQELKKDVLDRLPQEQKEEIEVYLEIFRAELEGELSTRIEKQVLQGEDELVFRITFVNSPYSGWGKYFVSDWDIFDSLGVNSHVRGDLSKVYINKTKQAIEEQVKELKEMGYEAKSIFDIDDSFNNMAIEVNWREETKEQLEPSENTQSELKDKPNAPETLHILNENDKKKRKRWSW